MQNVRPAGKLNKPTETVTVGATSDDIWMMLDNGWLPIG